MARMAAKMMAQPPPPPGTGIKLIKLYNTIKNLKLNFNFLPIFSCGMDATSTSYTRYVKAFNAENNFLILSVFVEKK